MDIKDHDISKKIKNNIDSKMGDSAKDINVYKNKYDVEISGYVDVLYEKNKAENIAAESAEAANIRNTITIAMGNISDKQSAAEVNSKLKKSPYQDDLKNVTAKVSGGTAILDGKVETQRDRKKALEEATKGFGIKDVVSHIDISSQGDDVNIANEINRRYETSYIDVQDLSSIVDNGSVKLYGFVNNKDEANSLVSIAEEINGVKKVTNNLKIRDWNLR